MNNHIVDYDPSMKNLILTIVILIVIAVCSTLTYARGYNAGVTHAIEDSVITVTSFDSPDGNDLAVNIELDEDVYVHTAWIG